MEILGSVQTYMRSDWIEITGWIGAILTLGAYSMRTMLAFRLVAVFSNVAFLTYGLYAQIYPTLALHMALVVLNGFRLAQILKDVRRSREDVNKMDWLAVLKPFATKMHGAGGSTLFALGDASDNAYVILTGKVVLKEIGLELGPGELIGEIGFFTKSQRRTLTAVCASDCQFLVADEATFMKAYYQSPQIGLALLRTIATRLVERRGLMEE